jgi:hypothetical protein
MAKDPEQERRDASWRVAIAKSAVDALAEALRGLRLQHKAALATYHQRLAEHSAALLARPKPGEGSER